MSKLTYYMTQPINNILIFLSALLCVLGVAVSSNVGKDTKRVLILCSGEKGHPAYQEPIPEKIGR